VDTGLDFEWMKQPNSQFRQPFKERNLEEGERNPIYSSKKSRQRLKRKKKKCGD